MCLFYFTIVLIYYFLHSLVVSPTSAELLDDFWLGFFQIAVTLAVGESALNFEHRDLHWGNVLISETKDKKINFILDGNCISTPSEGIQVAACSFCIEVQLAEAQVHK